MKNKKRSKIKTFLNRIRANLSAFKYWDNYKYCKKYPFMKVRNVWTGEFMGYEFTMLDDISEGWRKVFGQDLVDELKQAIAEDKCNFQWEQIKEKWGSLRLYASCGRHAQDVLEKYEALSHGYCISCGKPARYITEGYVSYLCDDCFATELKDRKLSGHAAGGYKHHCRLTKNDIPYIEIFNHETEQFVKIDYKTKYGIDFYELWGLKKDSEEEAQNESQD